VNKANLESQNNNSFSGQLNKTSLPYLLVYLQNNKQTGTLDIKSKYELTIFTDTGSPYFAAGGSSETLLGKILLNKNKITKYQYDRAVEEIKKDKDKRIGEILVSLGMITPHELNEYLDSQLKEKILESFLYLDGDFKFNISEEIRSDLFYSKLNPSEIIHEGFYRYVYASDINFDLIEIEIKNDLQEDSSNLGLGPKELRLVQLLNQKKTLNDIESTGQFKKDDILRVILLLGLHDKIDIKNIKINDFLLDVFKNFSVMNPLPDPIDSNYTVRESELTDPTGEVLLLDDELEATADKEKLKQNKQDDQVLRNIEPDISEKQADVKPAAEKADEVDIIEISMDDENKGIEIEVEKTEDQQPDITESPEISETESKREPKKELMEEAGVETDVFEDEQHAQRDILKFYEYIQNEEDYYKILSLEKGSTLDEVKEAYFKSIKKFHPDANMNFPGDIRVKAERIFTKVTKAYEILSDEQKRNNFDDSENLSKFRERANYIYEAEIIYAEGELLLRQKNFKEAEKKFIKAIELNPDESAYVGINAWAKYLAAPDKERINEEVKKELKRAIDMDKNVAENYYYLGSVYKFSDNLGNAEKYFTVAIQKDINYIEAKRELRLLQNRKGKRASTKVSGKKIEKKFWSGLFKK
jgi:curved DNA-binding protein CbpA